MRVRKEAENVSHDNPSKLFAESASVAERRDVGVCNECRAPEFEPGRVITERYSTGAGLGWPIALGVLCDKPLRYGRTTPLNER